MRANARSRLVATHTWPDAEIAWIAGGQKTLITHDQLAELGIRDSAIQRAVARGRLHRVHRGVYSLVPASARPPHATELAAILLHGTIAVISHDSAARIHELGHRGDRDVHVTLEGSLRRQWHRGITLHRTTTLPAPECTRRHGLPVTSIARTVIDLSPGLGPKARGNLLDEALKRTSRTKFDEALARHPGRPGTPQLKQLLTAERPGSRSASFPEKKLLRLLRRAGLPTPEVNVTLENGYKPDLLWPRERVIVEYDSRDHHSGPYAFLSDRDRHNRLEAEGYAVLHITAEQLSARPEEVIAWVAATLARAR